MIIMLSSKVRVACKKSGRKKRNYKKVGAVGADTTSNISPIPYTPPCGIVKIVAGCKNFACVCAAVERFLLHYLRYLWAS